MWFGDEMIKVAMPCSKFVMYHKCRKIQVSAASNAKMQFDIIAKQKIFFVITVIIITISSMTEREKVKEMKRDKFNERKSCYAANILVQRWRSINVICGGGE